MKLSNLLVQAQNLKAQLDALRPLNPENEARVMQKLRLDWNYHSSHIEGNQLTFGETKALILYGLTAQGKPMQDHLEVSGHDEAVKWIEEVVKSKEDISEYFIRSLHKLVLKQSYQKPAKTPAGEIVMRWIEIGSYKTVPNHVQTKTGEMFYFASPEETPMLVGDLMAWYQAEQANVANQSKSPLVLAGEFHYKFVRIHPFDDGNGRLARLLMNFILMRYGYPPVIIRTEQKSTYLAVLEQADAGILEPFFEYIAKNLIHSLEIMLKAAKGESIEDPDDLDKELALLEQKLQSKSQKIVKVKSAETLFEWLEVVFPRISGVFEAKNKKISKFYVDFNINIFSKFLMYFFYSKGSSLTYFDFGKSFFNYKKKYIKQKELFFTIKEMIRYGYNNWYKELHLTLRNEFSTFAYDLVAPFNYVSEIDISFEETTYTIIGTSSRMRISYLYHQQPDAEELDALLQAEAKAHTEFINEKIKK